MPDNENISLSQKPELTEGQMWVGEKLKPRKHYQAETS